jgi:hypothetical protein
VRGLDNPDYPSRQLVGLFIAMDFEGWIMLEAHGELPPEEVPARLTMQRELFDQYVAEARRQR